MIVKAAIGFLDKESDDDLAGSVQGVITGLTDNPAFLTPAPTLAAITTALADFTTALADAVNRDRELVAAKNAKRAVLVSLMRQLASYVTITSGGDMTTLLSSGFPHQKPVRQKVGTLPGPRSPRLRQGDLTGELLASTPPIYGASSYNWRVALASAPDTYVQTVQTSGARAKFRGLTAGQAYLVTVNAVGAAGPSDWSDDAELIVV